MPGFPPQTQAFLAGIAAQNDKAWFEANRPLYEAGYVRAGAAFVEAVGPRLREISPSVQFSPKINGSVSRINRDVRFSRDKRPYKDHLDLWFWHGDKRCWDCPGFYLRIATDRVFLGVGRHMMDKPSLDTFRHAVVLPRSGRALAEAVSAVKAAGPYEIGERTRKLPPRGFETTPDRSDFLLYEGLTATLELPAAAALESDFDSVCLQHFAATWPIGKWLLDEVGG